MNTRLRTSDPDRHGPPVRVLRLKRYQRRLVALIKYRDDGRLALVEADNLVAPPRRR